MSEEKTVVLKLSFIDESGNTIAERGVTATWPNNLKEQVSHLFDYNANTFIAEVLYTEFSQKITVEDIKEMIEEIEKKENG